MLDATRLLFDLQQVNQVAQTLSGCLVPETIAHCVTEALVQRFGCVFARLWLAEPDRTHLRLVSSSGLYTHIDGSFARVPMGAYKVGKIAQNRVPFLSNHLAKEPWVKDRPWAIANGIQGFAGYPLISGDRIVGVLAAFSTHPLAPEFLEVLQVLCMTTTVALDAALQVPSAVPGPGGSAPALPLSDRLAAALPDAQFTLVGTERSLSGAVTCALLHAAERLHPLHCRYCRLTYGDSQVFLEAIAAPQQPPAFPALADLPPMVACLGGTAQLEPDPHAPMVRVLLTLPYPPTPHRPAVGVQCQTPALQAAFTHLLYQAGLPVSQGMAEPGAQVLLTDTPAAVGIAPLTVWIRRPGVAIPPAVTAVVDLSMTPERLRAVIEAGLTGDPAALAATLEPQLSSREREVMTLLAAGWRDRSIAQQLHISESTVKFHINNSLTKLNAKNRYQGVYQAAIQGCI